MEEKFKLAKEERDAMIAYIFSHVSKQESRMKLFMLLLTITGINIVILICQILLWLLR